MGKQFLNKAFGKAKGIFFGEFPKLSYSRSGEDLLLDDIFKQKSVGTYVDVGAFHPIKYSNTFKFYLKGWRGINIDPNKEIMDLFNTVRPEDINLNLAVSINAGYLDYYMNNFDPSMNTISEEFAKESSKQYGFGFAEKRTVATERLDKIIASSRIAANEIDFLNIDVEGHDLEVLQSNDWNKIRPKIVLIEINCALESVHNTAIFQFMASKNYSLISFIYLNGEFGNGIFKNNDLK